MTDKTRPYKKKGFPIGIFLLIFVTGSLISAGALTAYFLNTGKGRIADIEKYTKNYSVSMAEIFGDMAELSFRTRRYGELKKLFSREISEDTIDQAFFVLNNGRIIVHSNEEVIKELRGNISNDEFTYNTDMILAPSVQKSRDTVFTPYNVLGTKLPFPRRERRLIKKYLYEGVSEPGWLVTRSVFYKKKAVGTVNFIISKERIYRFISSHIDRTKKLLTIAIGASFATALLLSLIIFLRYRSIQKKTARLVAAVSEGECEEREVRAERIEVSALEKKAEPSSVTKEEVSCSETEEVKELLVEVPPGSEAPPVIIDLTMESEALDLSDLVSLDEAPLEAQSLDDAEVPAPGGVIMDAIPVEK